MADEELGSRTSYVEAAGSPASMAARESCSFSRVRALAWISLK
jgi:hypothetical protein